MGILVQSGPKVGAKGGAEHGSEWSPDGSVVGAKRGFKAGLDGTKLGSVIGPNTVMNDRQQVATGIHKIQDLKILRTKRTAVE